MKILIIEDEKDLALSISSFVKKDGYICDIVNSIEKANEYINLNEYDCALVDIMLPDGNGFQVIKELKMLQPKCGIIVISAKNSLDDKINGLNIGADDYLTKPFHLAELNARIKSVFRRRKFEGNNIIQISDIKIDIEKRVVEIHSKIIELTKREYEILIFMITNKERVLTKESITEHVWGDDSNTFGNLDFVYTHIKNLRKKITEAGAEDYIHSVYGVGYKFTTV